ncbi:MAG: hypothetical protein ACOCX3_03780 [Chloroflexota bacterium]
MTLEFMDFDRDRIQVSFDGVEFAADGLNYADVLADQTDLRDAIDGITGGALTASLIGGNYERHDANKPTDPLVQTNVQWRVIYQDDTTGTRYTARIGTADLSLATLIGSGIEDYTGLDLSAGAGQTFKNAFEALVRSPDGNACTVVAVVYVQ